MAIRNMFVWTRIAVWVAVWAAPVAILAQQPIEPVDPTPQDGQVYELMNQASAMQLAVTGATTVLSPRDLTSPAQRWGLVRLADGSWKLENRSAGQCLAADFFGGAHSETCSVSPLENWRIAEGANGYSTLTNVLTGKLLTATASTVGTRAAANQQAHSGSCGPLSGVGPMSPSRRRWKRCG